jgi:hypothetical protein
MCVCVCVCKTMSFFCFLLIHFVPNQITKYTKYYSKHIFRFTFSMLNSSFLVGVIYLCVVILVEYVAVVGGHYVYLHYLRPKLADLVEGHIMTNEQHKYRCHPGPYA